MTKDKMNFLFCCENYAPSVGGVQEVVRQVAERIASRGHVVTIATGFHSDRPAETLMNGVRVRSFPISGNVVRGMIGPLEDYRRFILQGKFDAVLIKAAQQWSFDALIPVLNEIKARKVFIPCGFSGLYQRTYRDYYKKMPTWMSCFDALIFYANEYRDIQMARDHGLSNLEIVSNGADEREFADTENHDFRRNRGIGEGDLLLLTVGSITGIKGHWEVLRAFELARFGRPATLILNGNYPPRSRRGLLWQWVRDRAMGRTSISALVNKINKKQALSKRVIQCDLPRSQLVQAFKASDLFVFASHVEYSPLVLFEALAAGTPFVSTPVGNAREIAARTKGGRICETPALPNGNCRPNPDNLARAIEQLTRHPDQLQRLGQNGRSAFLNEGLSWAAISKRYEEILCGSART